MKGKKRGKKNKMKSSYAFLFSLFLLFFPTFSLISLQFLFIDLMLLLQKQKAHTNFYKLPEKLKTEI